ncbi:LysR family transcriptional regulator [Pseudomonas sp. Irchel 3E20]|uniref:LysR family transcriptional regulator n=1 Tax=Pseudomonas sp. Irchel 3E20 TaxID=2008983 RepID=UPI000BA34A42|nr:LysR family transcriptional regulator [Pseudomonas sp. Irchel 3E20]
MIETRLLRQFIAVAQELHFSKAAARLHMAQPPLSQAISRLEDKLGVALFIRSKPGVQLTPAGRAFLDTAYTTLRGLELGIDHARQVARGVAGTLTVSALSLACYDTLLDSLQGFRQALPQVRLVLLEMPSAEQARALLAGEVDIGFLRQVRFDSEQMECVEVLREPLLLALPATHPKAGVTPIELRDCADEDFVFTPQPLGSGYHQQLIGLCEAAGFYPRVVQEAAQMHTLIALVGRGFGVALVPASIASAVARSDVVLRPLAQVGAQPNPGISLFMCWARSNPSPLLEPLRALVLAPR